jgi:hypothetical protein
MYRAFEGDRYRLTDYEDATCFDRSLSSPFTILGNLYSPAQASAMSSGEHRVLEAFDVEIKSIDQAFVSESYPIPRAVG